MLKLSFEIHRQGKPKWTFDKFMRELYADIDVAMGCVADLQSNIKAYDVQSRYETLIPKDMKGESV